MSNNKNNNGDAIKAGLAGAAIGAVAGAAAVILSDEERRRQIAQKAREVAEGAKVKVEETVHGAREKISDVASHVRKGAPEVDAKAEVVQEDLEETEE